MQIYKYFDIGTGKPGKDIQEKIAHHLIDILEPHEEFNAFEFKAQAIRHANDLIRRKKIPLIVGGTGLYLKVFLKDFECAIQVAPDIRERVKAEMKEKGARAMHAELAKVDPLSAERILPTDPLRIERALSVYSQTGKPLSQFHANEKRAEHNFQPYFFSLDWDRARLYENIETRVESMLHQGWADEVRGLLNRGFDKNLKPFQGIGYAQIVKHFEKGTPWEQTVREIKQETRHYAKRQITWFKKVSDRIAIPRKPGDSPTLLRDRILSYLPRGVAFILTAILFLAPQAGVQAEEVSPYDAGLRSFKQADYAAATTHFLKVRGSPTGKWDSKRAVYLLGLISTEKGRYGEAITYFKTALDEFSEIEDYIRFELARAHYRSGQYPATLKEINRLLKAFPTHRHFPQAELWRAEILQRQGKTAKAINLLSRAVKRLSKMRRVFKSHLPELIFKLAQLHEEQHSKAYEWYQKLYIEYPDHSLTARAAAKMDELSRQPGFSPTRVEKKWRLQRIRNLLSKADFEQAVKEIEDFKKAHAPDPIPEQMLIYLARAYKGLGKREEVDGVLATFLKTYPGHRRTQEVMFLLARNLWNLSRDHQSTEMFRSLIKINPKSRWAIKGRFFLGKVHEGNLQFSQAREQYGFLEKHHRKNEYGQRAAWRLGWLDYREKRYETAVERFKQNIHNLPNGELMDANLFWMAKAFAKAGQTEKAGKTYRELYARFPYTYYGMRARKKLKIGESRSAGQGIKSKNIITRTSFTEAANTAPPLRVRLSGKVKRQLVRAREMILMGLSDNARFEIQQFESKVKKNYSGTMWIAELYYNTESFPEAYRLLELFKNFKTKAREKELPLRFWKLFYPPAYASHIETHAAALQVDPWLTKSIIRQESLFDKRSLSGAGARGLMQIMPETGQRLFSAIMDNRQTFQADDLFDPELNIHLGIKYLKELKEKYSGNRIRILICYNAGPEVLESWLKRFQDVRDPDVFIELIPYPETRNFVKRVLRNYGVYRALYAHSM